MSEWMQNHERHDDSRHDKQSKQFEEIATKKDLRDFAMLFVECDATGVPIMGEDGKMIPKFATKKDVAPVIELYDTLSLSAKITTKTGRFLQWVILTIAGLIIAFGIVTGGLKGFLAGVAAWATGGK